MRVAGWLALWGIVGCTPIEPAGGLFEPAPGSGAAVLVSGGPAAGAPAEAPPVGPQGGFDFQGEDRDDKAPPSAEGSADLGASLGVDPKLATQGEVVRLPAPGPGPVVAPGAPPAAAAVVLPSPADWGVRLVATVPDAQPPRAILGMPDGSEEVVQPGAMLSSVGVVVIAIGRDVVHVAEVRPAGDHATITSRQLFALQPGGPKVP